MRPTIARGKAARNKVLKSSFVPQALTYHAEDARHAAQLPAQERAAGAPQQHFIVLPHNLQPLNTANAAVARAPERRVRARVGKGGKVTAPAQELVVVPTT